MVNVYDLKFESNLGWQILRLTLILTRVVLVRVGVPPSVMYTRSVYSSTVSPESRRLTLTLLDDGSIRKNIYKNNEVVLPHCYHHAIIKLHGIDTIYWMVY